MGMRNNMYQPPRQAYFPSQMPPPKMQPPRKRRIWLWILLSIIALVLIGGGISQLNSSNTDSSIFNNTPVPTQVITQPPTRQIETPTMQQIGIPESKALLGGSIFAFNNKFGDNNCCNTNGWDTNTQWVGVYTAEDGSRWYQAVGEQSNERVVGIRIHPYDNQGTSVWDMPTAKKTCNAYMPSDAIFQKTYPHTFANIVDGVIFEYYSPLLAQTLPSNDFTDSNNRPEKPGIFFVFFDNASYENAAQIDFCALGTDANLAVEDVNS